jgi:sulfur carrier protein
MKVTVNGDEMVVPVRTLSELLAHLALDRGPVAVERNGEVVPRAVHAETALQEGDVLEIVHFVGGG